MADIPGIIQGASNGKGLGLAFLRHIERTAFLLFMLDINHQKPLKQQYQILQTELAQYSKTLAAKPYAIAFSKLDICSDTVQAKINSFLQDMQYSGYTKISSTQDLGFQLQNHQTSENSPQFLLAISAATQSNIKVLLDLLHKAIV